MKFLFLFLVLPVIAFAHVPLVVEVERYRDAVVINEPEVSQAFYGVLDGFPHNYDFSLEEDQAIFVQVLVPDIEDIDTNRSGIIVKRVRPGKVEMVSRLEAKNAQWNSMYEPFGGDSYLEGPSYKGDISAGEYRIEVSTPDNEGKYVLVVGELEKFDGLGILEMYKRIYEVKRFFGKSPLSVFQSPFYYVPGLLVVIVFILWRVRKRLKSNHVS